MLLWYAVFSTLNSLLGFYVVFHLYGVFSLPLSIWGLPLGWIPFSAVMLIFYFVHFPGISKAVWRRPLGLITFSGFIPSSGSFQSYWACVLNLRLDSPSQWWCVSVSACAQDVNVATHKSSPYSLMAFLASRSLGCQGLDQNAMESSFPNVPVCGMFHPGWA